MDNIEFIDDENVLTVSIPSEMEGGSFENSDSIGSSVFTISGYGKSSDTIEIMHENGASTSVLPAPASSIFSGKPGDNLYENKQEDYKRPKKYLEKISDPANVNTMKDCRLKSRCRWSLPNTENVTLASSMGATGLTGYGRYQLPFWLIGGGCDLPNEIGLMTHKNNCTVSTLASTSQSQLVPSKSVKVGGIPPGNQNQQDLPHQFERKTSKVSLVEAAMTPSPSSSPSFITSTGEIKNGNRVRDSVSESEVLCVPIYITTPSHFQNSTHLNSNSKSCNETCSVGLKRVLGDFMGLQLSPNLNSAAGSGKRKLIIAWMKNWLLVYPAIIFGVWAFIYILFGQRQAFPDGGLFNLFILEVFAIVLGNVCECLQVPPLLGMISAGLILRNAPISFISANNDMPLLPKSVSSPLRAMSVVVLLTRGAFAVSPTAIRNFWRIVPHLAVLSCVVEALVGGIAVYFIVGFPVAWSAAMGCIFSAMSGAVVMPYLASLASQIGCANENKVIAIARTACGLDAILAICMAECAFGFIFANGDLSDGFRKGIVQVIMGGAFGLFWGFLAGSLLGAKHSIELRTFAVFAGGVLSLLGFTTIGYPRGGPLGVFAGSLVTSIIWRYKNFDGKNNDQIQANFTKLWFFFQPLLFGIIGIRTDFSDVDWSLVSKGSLCIAICLVARLLTSFGMCSCTPLTWRQKMFIVITWIPKGTVQAALGPVVLDTVLDIGFGDEARALGQQVMYISVASIILCSSLGGLCLNLFGKPLLKKKV